MATKKITKGSVGRPKKAASEGKVVRGKKVNPPKTEPTEDEIH
jgi:hypothetical protein